MWSTFEARYLADHDRIAVVDHAITVAHGETRLTGTVVVDGVEHAVDEVGTGPIGCLVAALAGVTGREVDVVDYVEHARSAGAGAEAVAYVACRCDGEVRWGVGVDASVISAGFAAVARVVGDWT